MRKYITWWLDNPEWAMIAMSVGALLGLAISWLAGLVR